MSAQDMIDQIIININAIVDARGSEKCRLVLESLHMLAALRDGLGDEKGGE